MIRAAEQIGVQIPRFCDHPLLAPVGACRQCLVDVPDAGNGRGFPKPQASCTLPVAEGMVVNDPGHQRRRRQGAAGRHGVPADQPPARLPGLRQGRRVPAAEPGDVQRPRRVPLPLRCGRRQAHLPQADQHLRRRSCSTASAASSVQRCTRFSEQIAGDPFIALLERGALQQVGIVRERAVPLLLLRQRHPDLPGRRADLCGVPLPVAPLRPGLHAVGRRARRVRRGDPRRPPPRQGHAPPRRQRPRGQRGVDHRQGPLRVQLRHRGRPDHLPAGARPWTTGDGELRPASWPEAFAVAARGLRGRRVRRRAAPAVG